MVLVGYSGHAFVAADILSGSANPARYYCDKAAKVFNPFDLRYLGNETDKLAIEKMHEEGVFIAIGDNKIRAKIHQLLHASGLPISNAIHPSAIISSFSEISGRGIMIAAGVVINPLVKTGDGIIFNSRSVIEHECSIGAFSHIGPGAILCGNVVVGEASFIGAGAVVRQGITIGRHVIVGAGATVVKDIPDNAVVMGTPAK
jgi:sugar O-acyltransferase (sialic acid O-acetyltransferase NeuD family)